MKNILFIVGSFRKGSFNKSLAKAAEEAIGDSASVSYLSYEELPFMNQDIEFPAPEEVARVREEVKKADAIWIFTPEYNYQIPGTLKNLLDWLSRPLKQGDFGGETAAQGKVVTISGAGGRMATASCRDKLNTLLTFMRMKVVKDHETGVAVPGEAFATGVYEPSEETKEQLRLQAKDLLDSLN